MRPLHPLALVAAAISCNGSDQAGELGLPPAPTENLPEYVHTLSHSRFALGAIQGETDQNGIDRVVGAWGVFATQDVSRMVLGIPDGNSPELNAPTVPGGDEPQIAATRQYFLAAGLPSNQIFDVYAQPNTTAEFYADGGVADSVYWPMGVIQRGYHGICIVDSIASALMLESGASIDENVYWPMIPHDILVAADQFAALLASSDGKARYLAGLPIDGSSGRLVIRHTSGIWQGTFAAAAVFEVGVIDFDVTGYPVVLPDANGQTH
jgi:hypothetical protein